MILRNGLFSSESVSDGHPDKICDQISDAILDACLEQDSASRTAVEVAIKGNLVCVLGEVTTQADIDVAGIIRQVLADIGHLDGRWGLDPKGLAILQQLSIQSPDIAAGVTQAGGELGAGDQGLMFGYACSDTSERMPLPITLAHALMRQQKAVRESAEGSILGPDAKSQVTLRYRNCEPVSVASVTLSTQHAPGIERRRLEELVREAIIAPVIPERYLEESTRYLVNPTGIFEVGGPIADAGLTGRKIVVDTYGGAARHGGGAFSGKDPTKVDRSAAYGARQISRTIVQNGWAEQAELQVAYNIGVAEPVSLAVNTFGSDRIPEAELAEAIADICGPLLRPRAIIDRFALRRPIYRRTATFGHFGRDEADLPWEQPVAELSDPDLFGRGRIAS